jgi:hypothetical protein
LQTESILVLDVPGRRLTGVSKLTPLSPTVVSEFEFQRSYERGCQEKNSPLLPCEGKLFALHPAQRCGLAAYFLSVTQPVAGFVFSVSCRDGGSTLLAREAAQAGLLAPDKLPTMILCVTRGL